MTHITVNGADDNVTQTIYRDVTIRRVGAKDRKRITFANFFLVLKVIQVSRQPSLGMLEQHAYYM
jgi:hypothetical protein